MSDRLLFIIIRIVLLAAAVTIFILLRRTRRAEQQCRRLEDLVRQQAEDLQKENQLILMNQKIKYDVLQNQINPHFLYNTLENIRGRAIIDGNPLIAEMTEALARFFRYNISKDGDVVKLSSEIGNIQTYIQIQKYRFKDRILFQILNHADEEILESCRIPKMTLQPIVENAIFYGVESKMEQGHIDVHINVIGQIVSIIVSDDGQGMKKEQLEELNTRIQSGNEGHKADQERKGTGIALVNINNRLKLLYGQDYGIKVSSVWNVGTEVEILFPFIQEEERG